MSDLHTVAGNLVTPVDSGQSVVVDPKAIIMNPITPAPEAGQPAAAPAPEAGPPFLKGYRRMIFAFAVLLMCFLLFWFEKLSEDGFRSIIEWLAAFYISSDVGEKVSNAIATRRHGAGVSD